MSRWHRPAQPRPRPVLLVGLVVGLIPWFPVPGRTVADTKIDLVLDPWSFLARALSAWDPHASFGQLQNQSYGYLFPMGPFFGVGTGLGLPDWMVQRLWWSLVLLTAFFGCYVLVRRLGLGGPAVAIVAALAYALSPRMLTVLGPISVEGWPSAMAPWLVLAALGVLRAPDRAGRLRAAAVLGLATATVGGVNATATLAALAVPALFVLTAGRRGWRVAPWCVAAVVAGSLWWVVPLLVLGAYAYPFLDFIEPAAVTTAVTAVPSVLRGASHWVAFVADRQSGGTWPTGSDLALDHLLVASTAVVALVGLSGLLLRTAWADHAHVRRFAIAGTLVGAVVMAVGFGADLGRPFVSPFAGDVRGLLDGPLAALRNVHKLDPLVRLPLCLSLAVVLRALTDHVLAGARPGGRGAGWAHRGAVLVVVTAVLVTASPALAPTLAARGSFESVPERWSAAARLVDSLAGEQGGATLLAPASRFGDFTWGNTQDDPLEALASSPIVARDAIPLGAPGAIRQMDALDGLLETGTAAPGLKAVLARSGIGRVAVAHDYLEHQVDREFNPPDSDAAARTERALAGSGLRLVRSWGTGESRLSVWTTDEPVARAEVVGSAGTLALTGGPEAVVGLAATGALDATTPTTLVADREPVRDDRLVQTDTLRRRALDVASSVRDQYSRTIDVEEPAISGRRSIDFEPAGRSEPTLRESRGVTDIRTSSSQDDPDAPVFRGPRLGGAAAFDSDYDTAWTAAPDDDRPALSFDVADQYVSTLSVRLEAGASAGAVEQVEVDVDGELLTVDVNDQERDLTVRLDRPVQRVIVRLDPADQEPRLAVGVANIGLEGVDVGTGLRLPADVDEPRGSIFVARDPWSDSSPRRVIEDGRVLTRYATSSVPLGVEEVTVRPRATPETERLVDGWAVRGPRADDDMRSRPGAALDGDPSTRWTVGFLAGDPRLDVVWDSERTITGLSGVDEGTSRRTTVDQIIVRDPDSGESRTWTRGAPRFEPLTARRVVLEIRLPAGAETPFRVPDLTIDGAGPAPASRPESRVTVPCSSGSTVALDSTSETFSARPTRRQLVDGAVVGARRCAGGRAATDAGPVELRATSGPVLETWSVLAAPKRPGPEASADTATNSVRDWSSSRRTVGVPAAGQERYVIWHEGFNRGWNATLDGRTLEPVRIDGWRQGFVVPPGAGGDVRAVFAPQRTYEVGLVLGAAFVLVLLVVAAVPRRRSALPSAGTVGLRPFRGTTRRVLPLLVGAVLGGGGGVLLGVVAALAPRRWRLLLAAVAAPVLVATLVVWILPGPDSVWSVVPQALGIGLLCLLAREWGAPVGPPLGRRLDDDERDVRQQE